MLHVLQRLQCSHLQMSFFLANRMSALLRIKNSISRTTFILKLANKNISWKNWALSSLSFTWKLARIIPNVLRVEPSIFLASTTVELSWLCQSCQSCFSYLWQSFFFRQALAENSELLEQEVNNSGAQTLDSSSWRSFID